MAIVDTATLRESTSCPTSRRLLDAREAISSSFSVIFSMVVMALVLWIKKLFCSLDNKAPLGSASDRSCETPNRSDRIVHRAGPATLPRAPFLE